MKLGTAVASALLFALGFGSVKANPIDVNYTVSGSAGNWTYDFTVTNNLSSPFDTYIFGAAFPVDQITASPAGWADFATIGVLPFVTPGLSAPYYNLWRVSTPYISSISPGQTLSGFMVFDTSPTPISSLNWFAFDIGLTDPQSIDATANYTGPGCSMQCGGPGPYYNPGFQGTALAATPAAPEPSTWAMMLLGFAGLGFAGYRASRRTAAAAT